jgi:hypothetical protein
VSCWSDIQGTHAPHSSFPIPPRPRSLSWFPSVVRGAPSFVPCWFVVVPFIVDGPHRSFVAPFVCCGGPPFIRRGLSPLVHSSVVAPCPPLPSLWFVLGGDAAVSTRDPPCEQWLTSVGAGAGLSFGLPCPVALRSTPQAEARGHGAGAGAAVPLCWAVIRPPLPCLCLPLPSPDRHRVMVCDDVAISTCDPPCEQWLVVGEQVLVGVQLVVVVVMQWPWAFHPPSRLWLSSSPRPICCPCPCPFYGPHTPPSTLRAVARSGGGRCWVVFVALPLVPVILVVPIPAAPHFHPTSSGSWWQFGMLLCWQAWCRSATGRSEATWRGNGGCGVHTRQVSLCRGLPAPFIRHLPFVHCPLSIVLHSSLFIVRPSSFIVCLLRGRGV